MQEISRLSDRVDGTALTAAPSISVLLPCRNGEATIGRQLDALARQGSSDAWELIISDNGSRDGTLAVVERYRERFETLRVVDSSESAGIAHACNVAAAQAEGEALLVCNDDDEVAPGWLGAMARALGEHDLVACRLDHEQLNEAWVLEVRGRPQEDELPYWSFGTHLPFGFGCTLGIRRALHEEIGGFDERMLPAGEDVDYCWRAQYAGAEIRFVPDAVVHYRGRAALSSLYRQARNYGISDVLLYKKHRPLGLPELPNRVAGGMRAWLSVGRRALAASSKAGRALFLWRLGRQLGLLEGSARHRVLLL
jgi:GT2 family glycosyltransferase